MDASHAWPATDEELEEVQRRLARAAREAGSWLPPPAPTIAGVWFAAPTGSPGDAPGEPAWAAAVLLHDGHSIAEAVIRGRTEAGYRAGYLARREGPLLEAALRALGEAPDALLVNATGRDHPRGAGLALHLGAVLGIASAGVTDRPLLAVPVSEPGLPMRDNVPLVLDGELVAALVHTRDGARPIVVHAAWRTDVTAAAAVVLAADGPARTPEPLRRARRLARLARAGDEHRLR